MEIDYQPPPELLKLGHAFFNHDYLWGIDNFDEWAAYAIRAARLTNEERAAIKTYLDRILNDCDNMQLDDIWSSIGTCVVIATPGLGGARLFFPKVRDQL